MIKDNIIDFIEDEKIQINDNVYYHAFPYSETDFVNMITEGIKSPILIGERASGNNGYFYVSLSKKEQCKSSIYEKLMHLPMFVIDGNMRAIKVINYRDSKYDFSLAMNLPLPFRQSEYDDEYQKFLRVSPRYFLAIQYNLYFNREKYGNLNEDLVTLKSIVENLETQKVDLPIIDGSNSRKINKNKVKMLNLYE